MCPLIQCQGLYKTYGAGTGQVQALKDLYLSIPAGTAIGLSGPSGSGKSTLLHLIGALEPPSSGHLEVAGQVLTQLTDRQAAAYRCGQVGFVFQAFNLIPTLTVQDNVALPARLAGMSYRQARLKAVGLLARVDLDRRLTAFPDALSGGQQQRVALARALVNDPPVLLADEPTGNLDRSAGDRVLDLMGALVQERGMTLVMATHSSRALAIVDQVHYMEDGRLLQKAPNQ